MRYTIVYFFTSIYLFHRRTNYFYWQELRYLVTHIRWCVKHCIPERTIRCCNKCVTIFFFFSVLTKLVSPQQLEVCSSEVLGLVPLIIHWPPCLLQTLPACTTTNMPAGVFLKTFEHLNERKVAFKKYSTKCLFGN